MLYSLQLSDYEKDSNLFTNQKWNSKIHETVNIITDRQDPSVNAADGGLYVGIAGIGYMFYHTSLSPAFVSEKSELLKRGLKYIIPALKYAERHERDKSAFLLGNAGIYAVAAAVYNALGDKSKADHYFKAYVALAANCQTHNLPHGEDELLVGRAGYLCGVLWLEKVFGKGSFPAKDIDEICKCVIESGRNYARRHRSPCPLMYSYYDTEYLGAAHGLSGILQMLLSFPACLQSDPAAEQDVKASVDYLLSLQTQSGNFPSAMDELGRRARSEADELVHWCHGAPGVVYLMAKAYRHWKEDKYLKSCLKCGDLVWSKGLLRKGPGICHGVAGNGYVFLLLYRLTGDPKHLHRARAFAYFVFTPTFSEEARRPDTPYSLYEGQAGTVCYLVDTMTPDQAAFPFFDVF
ncbi:lanC-like protein 3 isoform X2 [Zootermopsis nevadensis]|uniref:lanC-like protein 3 isoform X2 n=1 Tax=Zootermopsis nevadensis TaxID=136037 RepID=UPI000B8E3055|nr:lanC-like protein 3 isoform X2 [Zootermopsis nevadensis]